jgi:peptide chain release factor 2
VPAGTFPSRLWRERGRKWGRGSQRDSASPVVWGTVAADPRDQLPVLDTTLRSIEAVVDVAGMRKELSDLEFQASAPDLWDDQTLAQKVTSRLSFLQAEINRMVTLRQRLDDLGVLTELAQDEGDAASLAEAAAELEELKRQIDDLEVRTLLSGEYDHREALVTIRSGAGGVDAADWAEMLLRMYTRYCERHNWPYDIYEMSEAEEAGIKSVTFSVKAPYAYGTLSIEQGTHRLVRISPFDNQGRRQTSFAEVEVVPVVEQTESIEIPDDELRVDVFRSSGSGGQHVNTTDSAVRITHIPTGIVAACQNERSQLQNKATAMAVLQAKLLERVRQQEKATIDALKGDTGASWGNQMRSYVLHPYQMVKDLRTEYETGATGAVLDGEIDELIEAGIRWRRSGQTD